MAKNPVKKIINKLPKLKMSFDRLSSQEVLVGVPAEEKQRQSGEMNNATLAYIHDNGSPAANIPARPFMKPGIQDAKEKVVKIMQSAAKSAMNADDAKIEQALHKAGLISVASIKKLIDSGIGPALQWSTVKGRVRNKVAVKGAKEALKKGGEAPDMSDAKPLVATAQMRNSINYVIRKKPK